jgi:putative ABC transport system substrate-binding protein
MAGSRRLTNNRGCKASDQTQARRQIIALAAEHHLPAMYEGREDGGLISYGLDIVEMTRRSAAFGDKILKGTNPADLPIEQPTRFELAVHAKSAKALGLSLHRPC